MVFDQMMWWTGLIVWSVAGVCGIVVGIAHVAMWTIAVVGWRKRMLGEFLLFVRQRRDGSRG